MRFNKSQGLDTSTLRKIDFDLIVLNSTNVAISELGDMYRKFGLKRNKKNTPKVEKGKDLPASPFQYHRHVKTLRIRH